MSIKVKDVEPEQNRKSFIKHFWYHFKRVLPDFLISCMLISFLALRLYDDLPQPLSLVLFKITLVSIAFLHAHITREFAFPRVNWADPITTSKNMLAVCLYVIFIFAYSMGS